MTEQVIRCDECKCQNRLPAGWLVDAYCRRCESALTIFTVIMGMVRSQTLMRSLQVVVAVAIVSAWFAGDVIEWWQANPFSLEERASTEPVQASVLPANSLAYE